MSVDLWNRLEVWVAENLPEASGHLRPGAPAVTITRVEQALGHALPASYVQAISVHDGDDGHTPTVWPMRFRMHSVEESLSQAEQAEGTYGPDPIEDPPTAAGHRVGVHGPVKRAYVRGRFPIMSWDACYVALDFDPPDDGVFGQVIGADVEAGTIWVIANDFGTWFEEYVMGLEAEEWDVYEGTIEGPEFLKG